MCIRDRHSVRRSCEAHALGFGPRSLDPSPHDEPGVLALPLRGRVARGSTALLSTSLVDSRKATDWMATPRAFRRIVRPWQPRSSRSGSSTRAPRLETNDSESASDAHRPRAHQKARRRGKEACRGLGLGLHHARASGHEEGEPNESADESADGHSSARCDVATALVKERRAGEADPALSLIHISEPTRPY